MSRQATAPGWNCTTKLRWKNFSGRRTNQRQIVAQSMSFLGRDWQAGIVMWTWNCLRFTAPVISLSVHGSFWGACVRIPTSTRPSKHEMILSLDFLSSTALSRPSRNLTERNGRWWLLSSTPAPQQMQNQTPSFLANTIGTSVEIQRSAIQANLTKWSWNWLGAKKGISPAMMDSVSRWWRGATRCLTAGMNQMKMTAN